MLNIGTLLQQRYRILRKIGGGGMGTVYLAEDNRLPGRRCAIKEMSPAQLAPGDRNWSIEAFRQEAQMLANLDHPGLTRVTDFFAEGGCWYLTMDYIEGETLEARLARARNGRLSVDEALRIMRQLFEVLTYLHNREPQVIFRDLKPANIMLTDGNEVKLIDFGIARFFKPGQTQDTVQLGTPGYAAPEQYGGLGQSDPRTDIYSLGAVLHQMVTGYDPTTAASPFPLPDPRSVMPNLPPHIADVIVRATQMRPALRYGTIGEMRQALFPPTYPLPSQASTSQPTPSGPPKADTGPTGTSKRGLWIGLAIAAIILVLFVGRTLGTLATRTLSIPRQSPATVENTKTVMKTATPGEETETIEGTDPPESPTAQPPTPTLTPTPDWNVVLQERKASLLNQIQYRENNGPVLWAYKVTSPPTLDGSLDEWGDRRFSVSHVAYSTEGNTWQGANDLSGYCYLAWDDVNLYLAAQVTDDIHVQTETGDSLFEGDEVEIQIDANLQGDFADSSLSDDDGQIGFSPGDFSARQAEAYIWRPPELEQPGTMIDLAARQTDEGYVVETGIPWWVLGGRPPTETAVGFTVNFSDNDNPSIAQQMLLLSTSPNRKWGDPTTWGTLVLVNWRQDESP